MTGGSSGTISHSGKAWFYHNSFSGGFKTVQIQLNRYIKKLGNPVAFTDPQKTPQQA